MRFLQRCRSLKCRRPFGILPEMIAGNVSKIVSCPHCGHKNKLTSSTLQRYRLLVV
ncbi:MAG: hypothetical protein M1165_02060 [Candidatus Pacearchaeota archaeon]|nr:hypothetical protein [Candidatus Pacearchaeota archaeon]